MKCTIGVFLDDARRRIGTLPFDSQGARQSGRGPIPRIDPFWLGVGVYATCCI